MPPRQLAFVVALFSAAGCEEGSAPAPQALPTAPQPAITASSTSASKLTCDLLVPQALREKHLPGTQMTQSSLAARTLMCSANRSGQLIVHITYDCRPTTTLAQWESRNDEIKRTHPSYKEIPGLGRAALGTENQLEFYDDDANCVVTVANYEGKPVLDLAKALDAALKPDLLPPVEKGKYSLQCDKLLPEELRKKFLTHGKLEASAVMTDAMECKFKYPDFSTDVINYNCVRVYPKNFIAQMREQYARNKTPTEDVHVGLAGLYLSIMGSHSVAFIDSDLGCLVNVMRMKGRKEDAIALAKAVDDALSATSAN